MRPAARGVACCGNRLCSSAAALQRRRRRASLRLPAWSSRSRRASKWALRSKSGNCRAACDASSRSCAARSRVLGSRARDAGGADWQIIGADGFSELDTRYTLETDTGRMIYVQNAGIRHAPPEVMQRLLRGETVDPELVYFRTVPNSRPRPGASVADPQRVRRDRRTISQRSRHQVLARRVVAKETLVRRDDVRGGRSSAKVRKSSARV